MSVSRGGTDTNWEKKQDSHWEKKHGSDDHPKTDTTIAGTTAHSAGANTTDISGRTNVGTVAGGIGISGSESAFESRHVTGSGTVFPVSTTFTGENITGNTSTNVGKNLTTTGTSQTFQDSDKNKNKETKDKLTDENLKDKGTQGSKLTDENLKDKETQSSKSTNENLKDKGTQGSKSTDENLKDKEIQSGKSNNENLKDKETQGTLTDENLKDKTKNLVSDTSDKVKSKIDENTNMVSLLKHARYCLEDFMNPNLTMEKQIPIRILSDAFGLVFLTEYKGSFGVGTSFGMGLIISRKPDGQGWTGPCAIGMGGMSIGFQVGLQKTEHIIVLNDKEVLKPFMSDKQLKLGGNMSFAVGPLGRDLTTGIHMGEKGYSAVYSYSMSKGAHIGMSLEGKLLMVRDEINEDYYGKKVSVDDILCGKIDSLPKDNSYSSLTKILEEYTQNKGQLSQDMFTSEENRQRFDKNQGNLNQNKNKQKSETYEKNEKFTNQMSNKNKHILDRLLRHARFNLEHFMNPKLNSDKQIPSKLLKNCYGLLFLTESKERMGVGNSLGAGFIIAHKPNQDKCSQPCAVSMGELSVGFPFRGKKTEHVLIFNEEKVLRSFIDKREIDFSGDISLSVGPFGHDYDTLNFNSKEYSSIYSYSTSNGSHVHVTLENQKLNIRDDWNEEYFGKKVDAKDILFGDIKPEPMNEHKSYTPLMNLLKEYKINQGKIQGSHWNEQERKEDEDWHSQDKESSESFKNETNPQEDSGDMCKLLSYAHCSLNDFVNPNLGIEKQIPINILRDAHALVFLTEIKAGFVVGASLGRGIILSRRKDKKGWTGPCAISLGGVSVGWLAGAEKTEHIIVLRDEKVLDTFLSNGQLKFGGDISFAVGPLGRDANIAISVNDRSYASIYSYSMSKGVYMGASLEGHLITIRNDTNEQYYGKKVRPNDILLYGTIEPPKDKEYQSLCESLDKYIHWQNQGDSDNKLFDERQKNQNLGDVNKDKDQNFGDVNKDKDRNFSDVNKDKNQDRNFGDVNKDKNQDLNFGDVNRDKGQNFNNVNRDKGDKFYSKNVDDQSKTKQNM